MSRAGSLIAVTIALAAGCVPGGEPPAGRRLVADRQAILVGVLPPTGDGVLRAFFTRPNAQTPGVGASGNPVADLYEVSLDPAGGRPAERLLVTGIDAGEGLGCGFDVAPCRAIDARGVTVSLDQGGAVRADAITGEVQPFMGNAWSQSGQRWFFAGTAEPGTVTLNDVDGQTTTLDDASAALFIGDDFFYVTSQGVLLEIAPSGVTHQMATGLVTCTSTSTSTSSLTTSGPPLVPPCMSFWGQATPDGIALVLHKQTPGPNGEQWSVRDPLTSMETWVPFDGTYAQLSPEGQWLLNGNGDASQFSFFNYRAATEQMVDIPPASGGPPGLGSALRVSWRPGTNQAWLDDGSLDAPTVRILEPNKDPVSIAGRALSGGFTPDGTYWLWSASGATATPVIQVGAADNPTGRGFVLNTPDTLVDPVSQFANGTLLVSIYTELGDEQTRSDVSVLDPRTGASRLLGERGRVAAVGQTRMMGMFHWDDMRGDLTVADPSGQQTILAPEFAVAAFAEPQGDDPLAPGTRAVYQFQARSESPYDGIWMVEVP